jgi:chromosome segregation protein
MKLTRLRLIGFKSFVEPSELVIEPGLTGVVGPNGCGKSNLVEALRWAMGESSYKALRASEMNDVIFAGSGNRPSRNSAEVVVVLDNRSRLAPSPFTDVEDLEISRRIDRDKGSTYRVNGREVRAKDVQLLFADASTGARSPALVRQGQIGEIINARPEARRRVLEEAAGIAGLHARRHEAELKLRAAEQNLLRVEDVLTRIGGQIDGLRRQARQAVRYRQLSSEIRALEAALLRRAHAAALEEQRLTEKAAEEAERVVAARTLEQADAAHHEALCAAELPKMQDAAAAAGSAVARLRRAGDDLDREERLARDKLAELERRIAQIHADHAREEALAADAEQTLAQFEKDLAALAAEEAGAAAREDTANQRVAETSAVLERAEALYARTSAAFVAHDSERQRLAGLRRDASMRLERLTSEAQRLDAEAHQLSRAESLRRLPAMVIEAEDAARAEREAEEEAAEAEADLARLRDEEQRLQRAAQESATDFRRLDVEARTLVKLLDPGQAAPWPPLIESLVVEPGYEAALVAALGEDVSVPLDTRAPVHWAGAEPMAADAPLPEGAVPLSRHVEAPPELSRRLAQIGVVARSEGEALRHALASGQCLVSLTGDLWRWDGFTATAGAETPEARRLAGRNRLKELQRGLETMSLQAAAAADAAKRAAASTAAAQKRDQTAKENVRSARKTVERLRAERQDIERQAMRDEARRTALRETQARLSRDVDEARQTLAAAESALAGLADGIDLAQSRDLARADAERERASAADARAALSALGRERDRRLRAREAVQRDRAAWSTRSAGASERLAELVQRGEDAQAERRSLLGVPDRVATSRRGLLEQLSAARGAEGEARDRLALAETRKRAADDTARDALRRLGEARERLAGEEARRHAARDKSGAAWERLLEAGVAAASGDQQAGSPADLERLKADRERLGGVNLRAEEELAEVQAGHEQLGGERDDLTEAIRQLRHAIQSLNREGRARLATAFEAVNAHFERLYAQLFGGGEARLHLIESEDPLEAGLEVIARPPGKKPQTLSLLSGGEQALTAMALIFAIFLTNPAPLCVLDEVDAPLDDANVERFCDLLDAMSSETDTRFLVVTHNPVTMSRMNRLFGVTMAERGVSQLVSVDLEAAEVLREAV